MNASIFRFYVYIIFNHFEILFINQILVWHFGKFILWKGIHQFWAIFFCKLKIFSQRIIRILLAKNIMYKSERITFRINKQTTMSKKIFKIWYTTKGEKDPYICKYLLEFGIRLWLDILRFYIHLNDKWI